MADIQEQLDVLTAGTTHVIERDELEAKLRWDRPLDVKLGIDPTASDIHLGFAVVLRKLRQFQDLGHTASADHRRLHSPGRGSIGPLDDPAAAL